MKNWKCIIGATLLTPVCLSVIVAASLSFKWVLEHVPYLTTIVTVLSAIFFLGIIWTCLYLHCVERNT